MVATLAQKQASQRYYASLSPERKEALLAEGRERHRRWSATARAKALAPARYRRYIEKHREAVRLRGRLNDMKRRQGTRPIKDIIVKLLNEPCAYCGGPGGTIDHRLPVSLGGTNDASNLVAACHSCNSRKGARLMIGVSENAL